MHPEGQQRGETLRIGSERAETSKRSVDRDIKAFSQTRDRERERWRERKRGKRWLRREKTQEERREEGREAQLGCTVSSDLSEGHRPTAGFYTECCHSVSHLENGLVG